MSIKFNNKRYSQDSIEYKNVQKHASKNYLTVLLETVMLIVSDFKCERKTKIFTI